MLVLADHAARGATALGTDAGRTALAAFAAATTAAAVEAGDITPPSQAAAALADAPQQEVS